MTVEEEMKRLSPSSYPYKVMSEIIESCKPKLSADEQRYVDFYRDLVQDPKNVDSRTKRLLDREAFTNGITPERQKELENIANI